MHSRIRDGHTAKARRAFATDTIHSSREPHSPTQDAANPDVEHWSNT